MRIYGCQFDLAWENRKANFAKARALLEAAPPERGSLVLLPEMFATGFSMNLAATREAEPSETRAFLSSLAAELGVCLMGGLVAGTADGTRGRNQAVVFDPSGREIARYTKIQPFALGGEAEHHEAGQQIVTFAWSGLTVAPFVCYDLRFPEIFRLAVGRGAQVMTVIANWPVQRIQHWVALLQARAIENQCYVAGVNRVGDDPNLHYTGRSLIVGPSGDILADAGEQECIISAEVDVEALASLRAGLPFLKDIRQDYGTLR